MTEWRVFRGRSPLRWLLGLAISAVSLWLLLRQVDLRQAGAVLSQVSVPLLAAAVAMYFASLSLRAWRWAILLRPIRPLSWRQVWPATVLGYAGNLVLPARLGELLRAAALRSRGVPMSAGLATIAAERMLDGLTTAGLVLLASRLLPAVPAWLVAASRVAGAVFGAGILVLWLGLTGRPWVSVLLDRVVARFPVLAPPSIWTLRFLDGLAVLHSPALLARVVLVTALAWAASTIEYWLAAAAVGVALSPAAAAFCVSAIGLSSAIPAAPGYIGTQELAGVTVLGLWHVPPEAALAASLAFHAIEIVPLGLAGLLVAWREGVTAHLKES